MSSATMSSGAPVTTFCKCPCALDGAGLLFDIVHIVMSRCIHHVAYLASSNTGGVFATCVPLLGGLLEDLNELSQTLCSAIYLA